MPSTLQHRHVEAFVGVLAAALTSSRLGREISTLTADLLHITRSEPRLGGPATHIVLRGQRSADPPCAQHGSVVYIAVGEFTSSPHHGRIFHSSTPCRSSVAGRMVARTFLSESMTAPMRTTKSRPDRAQGYEHALSDLYHPVVGSRLRSWRSRMASRACRECFNSSSSARDRRSYA
jgi:hypothetical protein